MARMTKSQADYIKRKFNEYCSEVLEAHRDQAAKIYELKHTLYSDRYKKQYPKWANSQSVIDAMVAHHITDSVWRYQERETSYLETKIEVIKEELNETLLFSNGTLDEAQDILNKFAQKLKEIQ